MRLFATDDAIGGREITNHQLQHCQHNTNHILSTIDAKHDLSRFRWSAPFKDGSVVSCGFHNSLRAGYRMPSSIVGT